MSVDRTTEDRRPVFVIRVRLRECNGFEPFNDPLPSQQANAFLLIKKVLSP